MANITLSVDNTNNITLKNNDSVDLNYVIKRAVCTGNSLSYSQTTFDYIDLPQGVVVASTLVNFKIKDDGLYQLITNNGTEEIYYFRVTGNLEACERALLQDLLCSLDQCDKFEYNVKVSNMMTFFSYKDPLYALLNTYQQEQSINSLINPSYSERLNICYWICLIKDLCNCVEIHTYDTNISSDCGCSK